MEYKWKIERFDCLQKKEGLTNVIKNIHWLLFLTENNLVVETSGYVGKTDSYSLQATDYIVTFGISTAKTCTVPVYSTSNFGAGKRFIIRNLTSSLANLTVQLSGADVFDVSGGATSLTLAPNQSVEIVSFNNSVWSVLNRSSFTGTGTTNYLSKWNSASGLANSQVFDNGTGVSIGSTTTTSLFNVGNAAQFQINSVGEVAIGTTINAASILTLTSTTKGVLFPRMTTAQKNAIASPTAGLVVYDTTLNKMCVYTTAWETITSA